MRLGRCAGGSWGGGPQSLGRPGLVPTAHAIADAIYDAVGIRLRKLPMKPEMVLEAVMGKG